MVYIHHPLHTLLVCIRKTNRKMGSGVTFFVVDSHTICLSLLTCKRSSISHKKALLRLLRNPFLKSTKAMQMKANCYNLEGIQDTIHHGQIDDFIKNWSRKQIQVDCLTTNLNYLLLEIYFRVNC